ncbi:hypothetical protein NGRA_2256 [Nosema granulosis]|uniref:Uncharacterized protein n=1 Tax=Nosema granulosis TaxID=83296 RepID=A0A9P6GYG7_9MICR|nr:hypothetical protein NGRA_2256 [Nosema granulosis]
MEAEAFRSTLEEKEREIGRLEGSLKEEKEKSQREYNELLEEYQRVCGEKDGIYGQFIEIYKQKVSLEKQYKEVEEEACRRSTEVESMRSSLEDFHKIAEKYQEVNNELFKSNGVVREYKARIGDLTKRLEESEQRYSKYILSNRKDVVAILGRELGYIRNKIMHFSTEFMQVSEFYFLYISEQDRLTEMYRASIEEKTLRLEEKTLRLEEKSLKLEQEFLKSSKLEEKSKRLEESIQNFTESLGEIVDGLYGGLRDLSEDFYSLLEGFNLLQSDLSDKENIIRSLVENNTETYEGFLKRENRMLKNEVVLLNAKIDNLQSEEYKEVVERLERIRIENENLREYISNLNSEIVNKDQTVRNLENNLQQVKEKLGNRISKIEKYEKIIEKLRKIKDEYVKLRSKQ